MGEGESQKLPLPYFLREIIQSMAGIQVQFLSRFSQTSVSTPLSAVALFTPGVIITTGSGNAADVYVGGSDVSATKGIPIPPGQSLTIQCPLVRGGEDELTLNDLYLFSTTSAQLAYVAYFYSRRN